MRWLLKLLLIASLFSGCSDKSITQNKEQVLQKIVLENKAIINASIFIRDLNNTTLYQTKSNQDGVWKIPKDLNISSSYVVITANALYKNRKIKLCSIASIDKLYKNYQISINIATTFICSELKPIKKNLEKLNKQPYNNPYLNIFLEKSNALSVLLEEKSWQDWKDEDFDSDNITNYQELILGLNLLKKDSDSDGVNDNDELETYHTNPLKSDSDSDYLPDGYEITKGSNPLDADEDGNGIKDGLEGDEFFSYQWYIYNPKSQNICTTTDKKTKKGVDLNILKSYSQTLGRGLIVQVVDSGVDINHSDIELSLAHSYGHNSSNNPAPTKSSNNPTQELLIGHGTMVAGIIAAKGFNNIGIRGVAPNVKIAGSNWLENEDFEELANVWLNGKNANDIVISNNSWGKNFFKDSAYEELLAQASQNLREKKGRIFVFAAGNSRKEHVNANLSYLLNNPYVITVASLNADKKYASYSNAGSNVFISAYGGEKYYESPTIMTTFLHGKSKYQSELNGSKGAITIDEDINKDYTFAMNGTSAAAPMVSGEIALVLSVCPNLSYRDIKWLIATTAEKIDSSNSEWIQNAAHLWHNNNYGFGLINTTKIMQECLKPDFKPLSKLIKISKELKIIKDIPDNKEAVTLEINIDKNITIEWVGLTVTIDHPYVGDIDIKLTSPSKTKSHIIEPNFLKSNAYKDGFRFASYSFLKEQSKGIWRVEIRDLLEDDSGELKKIKLEIWGHKNE